MFKRHFQYRHPETGGEGGGGGGGDGGNKGALDAHRAATKGGGGNTVSPADARAFLADFAPDPAILAGMKDEDAVAYHGRVTGRLTKAQAETLAAAGLKLEGRPDWLPEPFFDVEKGQIRYEGLVKSWKDTRAEVDRLKAAGGAKPPESAEAYAFDRPKDLPAHLLRDVKNDASLKVLRESAFEAGMTQDQFSKMATGFYKRLAETVEPPVDPAAEIGKLGKNGAAVADAAVAFIEGFGPEGEGLLSEGEVDELVGLGRTAVGIRALNKLRERMGGTKIPVDRDTSADTLPSKAELDQMVADDRYTGKNGKGDEAFRAKVAKLFEEVHGNAPAGSSEIRAG